MERIYTNVGQLVGHTPLLEPVRLERALDVSARILCKIEGMNPAGSVKDRAALSMLDDFEARDLLKPGGVIIEPTSGNTGIGLAAMGVARGYRVILVMPDTMSVERRQLMGAYGAEVVLSDGKMGMAGAVAKAEALQKEIPGALIAGQFENPANPAAHYRTTGPEIWEDTAGRVDIFVAGVGTGGTVSGVGRYLKEKKPEVKIVAVEPKKSPLLSEGHAGPHGLQGIGANFVPKALDTEIYDEIVTVLEEDAYETARLLGRKEGILAGITSGAALWVAVQLAKRMENAGKTIVALLPDTGERYLSTPLFRE